MILREPESLIDFVGHFLAFEYQILIQLSSPAIILAIGGTNQYDNTIKSTSHPINFFNKPMSNSPYSYL